MMRIRIIDEFDVTSINDLDVNLAKKELNKAFTKRFKTKDNVTVILVDEARIKEINNFYRKIDKVTDVISFEEHEDDYLGEIFICIPKAISQAKEYNHSLQREFTFLMCHGLLHLHGYDHLNSEDEKEMFKIQDEIMDSIIKR